MLNNLSDNLNMLMARARVSSDELARQIKIPATTIKRIRNNDHANPTITTLIPIANYFSVSLNQLVGMESLISTTNQPLIKTQKVPLFSWEESVHYAEIEYMERAQYINVERIVSEKAFALIVEDTDLDFFPKHCIILIDPMVQPLNGDYVIVANMKHNKPSIRKYIVEMDQLYLKPLISGIGVTTFTSEYKILGVILQYKVELK